MRVWAKKQFPGGPSAGLAAEALEVIDENVARLGPVLMKARKLGMDYCTLRHVYSDCRKFCINLDGLQYTGLWESIDQDIDEAARNMVEWWEEGE